jgi:shikimate 5-dehydrogenase
LQCWALQTLGVTDLLIANRTAATAAAMAARFHVVLTLHEVHWVAREELGARVRVVVGCVPADVLDESQIPEDLFGGVPASILVEMAYRPPVTATMRVAAGHPGWTAYNGLDVLKQ